MQATRLSTPTTHSMSADLLPARLPQSCSRHVGTGDYTGKNCQCILLRRPSAACDRFLSRFAAGTTTFIVPAFSASAPGRVPG